MDEWRTVSRQALWDEFLRSAEHQPQAPTPAFSAAAPAVYFFGDQINLIAGDAAGAMVKNAAADAEAFLKGSSKRIVAGSAMVLAGFGCAAFSFAFIPLFVLTIVMFYSGMTILRAGTDRRRRAHYDQQFAADVERYARLANTRAGGGEP